MLQPNQVSIIAPLSNSEFSYENLPDQQANYLRNTAARLHVKIEITYQLISEIGAELLSISEILGDDLFRSWCESEFSQGFQTLKNWMAVASKIPKLPKNASHLVKKSTLYEAAKDSANPEGVQTLYKMLEDGKEVDYQQGYIICRAPSQIRDEYLGENIPKGKAFETAKLYNSKKISSTVSENALRWAVCDPDVLLELQRIYSRHIETQHHKNPSQGWKTLIDDNGILNGIEWATPLSKATKNDIQRWLSDRQKIHIEESTAHKITYKLQGSFVQQNGTFLFEIKNPPRDIEQFIGENAAAFITINPKGVL